MNSFVFDFWTLWGIGAQALFFSRFILQWYSSEKKGAIAIPPAFWVLSLLGAGMIFVYALARRDLVFLVTGVLQLLLYSRSLVISRKENNHE